MEKSGWLSKRGDWLKIWRRRWFILSGTQLNSYQNPESSEVIDTIDLTEVSVWKDRELGYDNCFQIYHPARGCHYLYVETANELEQWIAAIKDVSAKGRKVSGKPIESGKIYVEVHGVSDQNVV